MKSIKTLTEKLLNIECSGLSICVHQNLDVEILMPKDHIFGIRKYSGLGWY